ncbi:MAG: glycosyltransferase family 2 protein [Abditibacteriales bacterium]|nr:glycosyltransferase family 2 protein [Abditibacteriales bacterium]MDW8365327.1 glycosyltransferase family 2 protein [Abditibacteriales bacterium]
MPDELTAIARDHLVPSASPITGDLSVCIVTWNARDDLRRCLQSLFAVKRNITYEVIVVDNASTDGSAQMVTDAFPQTRLIVNPTNIGFARANNQAIREAGGKYILLLNPDTIVHGDALERLVAWMEQHPDAGAVGPRLLNSDGSLQFSCRAFPTLGAGFFRQTPLGALFPRNRFVRQYLMTDWDHTVEREVDWLSGAALMVRREVLESVGLLDEGFYMYCEDVDWCYRMHQHGWKVYYVPHAVITHAIGGSSNQCQARMIVERHKSMWRYYLKHNCRGASALLLPVVFLGLAARAVGALTRLAYNLSVTAWRKRHG